MANYNFEKDLKIAQQTEMNVALKLTRIFNWKIFAFNNDAKYDIVFKDAKDNIITVEVKEDFTCARTNNVGLEYSCRGKPSGISISKADYYFYRCHRPNNEVVDLLIKTSTLKEMVDGCLYFRTVNGGDKDSNSLNYLFKFDILRTLAEEI